MDRAQIVQELALTWNRVTACIPTTAAVPSLGELSPRTFWNFTREFSSVRRQEPRATENGLISDTVLALLLGRPRDLLVLGSRLETHGSVLVGSLASLARLGNPVTPEAVAAGLMAD